MLKNPLNLDPPINFLCISNLYSLNINISSNSQHCDEYVFKDILVQAVLEKSRYRANDVILVIPMCEIRWLKIPIVSYILVVSVIYVIYCRIKHIKLMLRG